MAIGDLDGTGDIAAYGPPCNDGTGSVQYLGPISRQELAGVTIPINPTQDFVIAPLEQSAKGDPALARALADFQAATSPQRQDWEKAFTDALTSATVQGSEVTVPNGPYGPVGPMMAALLRMGQDGGLDGYLLTSTRFYQTDYTRALLFIQGDPLHNKATSLYLLGSRLGMTNETDSYPGQAWIWLYTLWYQIPPFSPSANGDALVWVTMAVLTLGLILVPFIPGLNQLPRHVRVYRLIWRDWYRQRSRHQEGEES